MVVTGVGRDVALAGSEVRGLVGWLLGYCAAIVGSSVAEIIREGDGDLSVASVGRAVVDLTGSEFLAVGMPVGVLDGLGSLAFDGCPMVLGAAVASNGAVGSATGKK